MTQLPQPLAEKIEDAAYDFCPIPGELERYHFKAGAAALYSLLAPEIENLVGALEYHAEGCPEHIGDPPMDGWQQTCPESNKAKEALTRWRQFVGEKNQGDE